MSQASRDRQRARDLATGRDPYERSMKKAQVELSKARLEDVPPGKVADTVRGLAARYPEGLCVKNRDEWGWVTDTGGAGLTLFSVDAEGGILEHTIPPGQFGY